ncbi:MAG: HAD hydrolase-like protein [Spirochaetes bacterium]|nr:HAD hydrolase-like protein [Spirochaetota bacterium]
MSEKPLLILDMDGVIVDVTGSYREVVRRTVLCYLSEVIGADGLSRESVTLGDIAAVKNSGGLNNDWELTYELIDTVLGRYFDRENAPIAGRFRAVREAEDDKELLSMCRSVLASSNRRSLTRLGETPVSRFYSGRRSLSSGRSPFLLNGGDVKSGNLAKRIFQELYLGKDLFYNTYGEDPLFYDGTGYVMEETLIPRRAQLEELSRRCKLAIATGRPRSEAVYALERFGITRMFAVLVTEDDVMEEERLSGSSLRKPHPFMLERCLERCGCTAHAGSFYVGDMPDDMIAGKRANMMPLGFVYEGLDISEDDKKAHRTLLVQNGARKVFGNYGEILRFFGSVT